MRRLTRALLAAGTVLALAVGLGAAPAQAAPTTFLTLTNQNGKREQFQVFSSILYHRWENTAGSGNYSEWVLLKATGNPKVHPGFSGARNQDGRLEIFVHRRDVNDVMHIWQTSPGSGWSNWWTLDGAISTSEPGVSAYVEAGLIHIVVRGTDGRLHSRIQQQPNCCWTWWQPTVT